MAVTAEFEERVLKTIAVSPEGVLLSEVRSDIGCPIDALNEAVNRLLVARKVRTEVNSAGAVTVFPVAPRKTKNEMSGFVKLDYKIRYDIIGTGDVDDVLARSLRGYLYEADRLSVEKLSALCKDNDIEESRFARLNPGHIRMCVGNMLRARVRRGEEVWIGGIKLLISA